MKDFAENMAEKLNKMSDMYKVSPDTEMYQELMSYKSGLDDIKNMLDDILKEIIITTAESYGLYMREKLWGVERTDLDAEKRRDNIIKRLMLGYGGFKLEAMNEFLTSLGVNGEITEVAENYRIYIYVTNGENFSTSMRRYVNSQIEEYFPAHLEVFTDYRKSNWDTLDTKQTMFSTYDTMNMTFEQLENFE